ncbi:MAG: transcriptional repressor [Planctomycetia bacterium]|nr:transcriptional repressor [Planctomycetia bacterium]
MQESQDEVLAEFTRVCRGLGWKMTAPRYAVYRFMRRNTEHPVVDRVWNAVKRDLPAITRESVYRILNDFAEAKLIAVLDRSDVIARFDADVTRHDHFYCEVCGRVYDFKIEELPELAAPHVSLIGEVRQLETRVRGVCYDCLRKEKTIKQDRTKNTLMQDN